MRAETPNTHPEHKLHKGKLMEIFRRFLLILVFLLPSCGGEVRETESKAEPGISAPAAQPVEALIEATKKGDLDEVRRLLDEGANPDAKTKFEEFALLEAAANRHPDIVALLLARGADPNLRDITVRPRCSWPPMNATQES